MELLDIRDRQGNKTGKIIQRGEPFLDGEYSLVVHIYICNSKGDYLIQKRSRKKRLLPGIWDITAGAVISGEESIDGAIREVQEEIGIVVNKEAMTFVNRLYRKHSLADIWFAKVDFDITDCILQEDEVDEVKFVTPEVLYQMVSEADHRDEDYKDVVRSILTTIS
jgi:isopentenyldiphosphate isomerase